MKAALPRCARCRAVLHSVEAGGRCYAGPREQQCLWRRALRKLKMPRAREVLNRLAARRDGAIKLLRAREP